MAQGLLPFQLEQETASTGLTSNAGLTLYLDLMAAMHLPEVIAERIQLRPSQGFTDTQQIIALLLLNLSGGDFLEDLDRLEADEGLCALIDQIENWGRYPDDRQRMENRWRVDKKRTFPSPDAAGQYLEAFDGGTEQARKQAEGAYVPEVTEALDALRSLVSYTAAWSPPNKPLGRSATLDMDASMIESHKRTAKRGYKGYRGFQPIQVFWWERQMALFAEYRDGNCPAAWHNPQVFKQALDKLPDDVEQVRMRTDTAGYDHRLLKYCADGHNERFGTIEFAVGVDVTPAFKQAVSRVSEWHTLESIGPGGVRYATGQQWARVDFVPNWLGYTKRDLGIRFFVIREPLSQPTLLEEEPQRKLPFPTMEFEGWGRSKVFGVVSNRRDLTGDEIIRWHRKRNGYSEHAHSEFKYGLAGAHPPSSDHFQANAAWWQIALVAYNLHVLMQTEVLGPHSEDEATLGGKEGSDESPPSQSRKPPRKFVRKRRKKADARDHREDRESPRVPKVHRLKTERFRWLKLPARIIRHARRLIVRLSHGDEVFEAFVKARERITRMTRAPPTRWLPIR